MWHREIQGKGSSENPARINTALLMFQSINRLPKVFSFGLLFPIIFLNGWLLLLLIKELQPLVSILIAATLIAFLLEYPIRFLQERGVQRGWATGLVFLGFVLFLGLLGFFLGPLILQQANELLTRLPEWIESGRQQLRVLEDWAAAQQLPIDLRENIIQNIAQISDQLSSTLRSFTRQLINLIFSAIGSIANVFLTLIFAIFLVFKGESLWGGILSWLPPQWNQRFRQYLPQNFERYIAGQTTMSAINSLTQTTALVILGAPLSVLFGVVIGVGSMVPLGGVTTLLVVSFLISLQNFWLGIKVLAVNLLLLQINDNAIAPRIIGEITGLNPVWMLVSIFLGVKLGGGLGLIVAVPIASFIKGTFDIIRASKPDLLLPSGDSSLNPNGGDAIALPPVSEDSR